MAGPPFTRASRQYKFTAATGSSVLVKQYTVAGALLEPGVLFDIELGVLTDVYINQDVTHSGSNGATLRERTGGDWSYALTLSFPAALIGGRLEVAFVQQLLGSNDSVWMRFNMGDPEFWSDRALPPRSFLGRKSLLGNVVQRFDVLGKRVVGLNVAGEGNSLLRAELNYQPVWP